jgi:hypothetical protein
MRNYVAIRSKERMKFDGDGWYGSFGGGGGLGLALVIKIV